MIHLFLQEEKNHQEESNLSRTVSGLYQFEDLYEVGEQDITNKPEHIKL